MYIILLMCFDLSVCGTLLEQQISVGRIKPLKLIYSLVAILAPCEPCFRDLGVSCMYVKVTELVINVKK